MSRLRLKNYLKQKYHLSSCIKYFIYKVTEMVKMVEYNFPGLVFMHTVQKMKLFILLLIEAIISSFWCYCFCLKFDYFGLFSPRIHLKSKTQWEGVMYKKTSVGQKDGRVNKHTKIHLSNNYKQNVGQMCICVVELLLLKVIVVLLLVL